MKNIKCQFCDKFCSKGTAKEWQICHPCDVSFRIHKKKVELIHFKIYNGDNFYTIMILLTENKSSIFSFKRISRVPGHHATLVASFDHIINITPSNVQDKLKTYLLFL